jgi:hypothetical protein
VAQSWTYDPTQASTGIHALRLQLADTDFSSVGEAVPRAQQSALFSDQEYQAFLTLAGNDVTAALVKALYTIANNRAIMAVAVNLGGGGSVDWGRLSSEIRAQAQAIWTMWQEQPAEAWAEVDASPEGAQRIWWNALLRQAY